MRKWVIALLVGLIVASGGMAMFRIGMTAIIDHPALEAAREGIIDELIRRGLVLGTDFVVEFQSAQGNMNTAVAIANYFRSYPFDVVVALSTPSAQTCANAIQDIPVVFTAVTDPVDAELIPALGKNPGNVVGVSDMTPVRTQFQLIRLVVPKARKVGILVNPGEANSLITVAHAREACAELGLELLEIAGSNTSEMIAALTALVGQVDAVYVGTDNTAASCVESLHRIAQSNKVPLITGFFTQERANGVISYGFEYYNLGLDTGTIVWDLLHGKPVSELESRLMNANALLLLIDLDTAQDIGLQIPEALMARADYLVVNGVQTRVREK